MHILALPVIIAGNSLIYADNHSEDNIIERIQIESKGNVIIDIPENIRTLILHSNPKEQTTEIKPGVNKLAGFRIQVFSDGRNQHTLEARAKARVVPFLQNSQNTKDKYTLTPVLQIGIHVLAISKRIQKQMQLLQN